MSERRSGFELTERLPSAQPSRDPGKTKPRINLERASILLMDNSWGVELLARMFMGFGARKLHRCRSVAEAIEVLDQHTVDLIVTEALIDDQDVYEFVRGLRHRSDREASRFAPVIMLSAHTASQKVAEARDCGANFFVAKPLSPKVMMDRVRWVAGGKRQYLETDTYAGPDRRFHDDGPPSGKLGRRKSDPQVSVTVEENRA
jgi:DNA-binding response OmpR family regulator